MATLEQLVATLSPDDNLRGHQFEPVAKWFLENDPVQKAQFRRVWLWKDWPGSWAADAGIDLVAERKDRSLVAVQVKCYRPDRFVSKRDIDTFLSESSREVFAERLLIATCDLGRTARRTVEGQEKPVHTILLDYLEHSPVTWPADPRKLKPFVPNPRKPRPHQRRAIRDVLKGFETAERGQLIMACGTGKTLGCLWISEALEARRTLVLVPSLSLLSQTVREWMRSDRRGFGFLAVCSDQTVVDEDAPVSHTADLPFTGVTTQVSEIAAFLRKRGPGVVFATYQSSPKIAAAQALPGVPRFDIAIADEAHRCAGRPDVAFGTILDAGAIKARRRLFTTATPRIAGGSLKRAAEDFDLDIASMDDERLFGPVFHRLSFGEAIERDLLSDYQVAVVVVDDETIRDYAERGVLVELDGGKVRDARTLAAQIGLAKAMRKFGLRRTLTFHSRVKSAADFAGTLPSVLSWMPRGQRPVGKLWTAYVSGLMPSGQRDRLLRRLAATTSHERAVLSNARCLTEGVDVPTLDGVAFVDPRRSQVDVVQAVGRAIRKAPGKSVGTIVLPVFVAPGEVDLDKALGRSVYEPIVQVLRALRDHDERLGEELDALRRELGRRGSMGRLPDKVWIDAPTSVSDEFVAALEVRVVELSTRSWEYGLGALQRFVDSEEHADVPTAHRDAGGFPVGTWVGSQRMLHARGDLTQERIARLEALPGWIWGDEDRWEREFDALERFVVLRGDARVPSYFLDEDGRWLGRWVVKQRAAYRRGRLTEERAVRLTALPGWVWREIDARWEEGFRKLQRFVARKGHARVPDSYRDEDGYLLGTWVGAQRAAYGRDVISGERVARLAALPGWTWGPKIDLWEQGFEALQRFVEREGHSRVPASHTVDGFKLGGWVVMQRQLYRQGRLSEERIARLESLAGWTWEARVNRWERGFEALQHFVKVEGNAHVPARHTVDGFKLGGWVVMQRQLYRQGRLSEERIARLEGIPSWVWSKHSTLWEQGFAALRRFVAREGTARVTQGFRDPEGYRLGTWVHGQRMANRRGELSEARISRLEALPGWVWEPHADRWEQWVRRLQSFVDREGHARVPVAHLEDGHQLRTWVNTQRTIYRRGDLSTERIARLEALPGWVWEPRVDAAHTQGPND